MGKMALGCGLTMVALPVIKLAYKPGTVFHVGKVEQPMTKATPLGTGVKVLSRVINAPPPAGFTQRRVFGKRDNS